MSIKTVWGKLIFHTKCYFEEYPKFEFLKKNVRKLSEITTAQPLKNPCDILIKVTNDMPKNLRQVVL